MRILGTAWQETGPGDDWTFVPDPCESLAPHREYRANECVLQDGGVRDDEPMFYRAVADFTPDTILDDWNVRIIELEEEQ